MAKKNKNESAEKKAPVKTTKKSTINTTDVNVDNEIKAEPVVKEQPVKVETFLDRLYIEKNDLDVKIAKLKAGLSSGKVPKTEVAILNLQLNTMQHYSKILETRINSVK